MPPHSKSEPDPPKSIPRATAALRVPPKDARRETDFADLAACFAAESGGHLSPALSADLALEIVLNEVAEQACLATGATGAAIALRRDGEMVCRASSGSTAPELGTPLDTASGLSGECIRTRRIQRCDDVLTDPRVDIEASQRLGVRSVMVLPLLRGTELMGVFELFSSQPRAFGERDELTLEALAGRILNNLERAAQPISLQNEPVAVSQDQENLPPIPEDPAPSGFDWLGWTLAITVIACAVLLGLLMGRRLWTETVMPRMYPPAASSTTPAAPGNGTGSSSLARSPQNQSAPQKDESVSPAAQPAVSTKNNGVPLTPGSLLVFKNGKEIFRMPPSQSQAVTGQTVQGQAGPGQSNEIQPAPSGAPKKVEVPAGVEATLLHRVEPQYPAAARQQGIQGAVVLDVHIGVDGAVKDIRVISGPQQLVQASTDAVKEWRFRPHSVNGQPTDMQTKITLNFKL